MTGRSEKRVQPPGERTELLCAYAGYGFVAIFFLSFWLLAGFIPPPDPSAGAAEIAERFRDNTDGIRLGMVAGMFASALLLPWCGVIAVQMKRIEGTRTPLVYTQIAATGCLVIEFVYPMAFWCVAAFRPEASAEFIQRFNDLAWLPFLGIAATLMVQCFALGLVILADDSSEPLYPRWVAYVSFWAGMLLGPAELIFFFKDGPFAWNGLISWWLVAMAFGIWMIVVTWATARAVRRGPSEPSEKDRAATFEARISQLERDLDATRAWTAS